MDAARPSHAEDGCATHPGFYARSCTIMPMNNTSTNTSANTSTTTSLTQAILFTDTDGRARFKDVPLALGEGSAAARLSALQASGGCQFRHSPVGFRSNFHCTTTPQWLVVLSGAMEIGLQDGSARVFTAGEYFYSDDTLPEGAVFDAALHGHCSRQVGDAPLVTLFVRC
jgi:hypothetical protein